MRIIINKFIPIKYQEYINKHLNKITEVNEKSINIILYINLFLLLLIILLHYYFSNEIYTNIDNYITVYNH